jgi:formate--tetrahydrofolate ligase
VPPVSIPSDLDIARGASLEPIEEVGRRLDLDPSELEHFGRGVAKVDVAPGGPASRRGLYVLVTAVTPTPFGEGKTATAVGLGQAMGRLGRRGVVTLRQPSMGPTFGIKGGAAGAGYSQVVPMERLNLHLTGDLHAVTAAHNLLAAMIDNHLHHGNRLGIDVRSITWRRVLDVNDRALRNVVVGLGAREDGVPRQSGFDITAASEVMAILALATSADDLRARLGRIVVGVDGDGAPVTAEALRAAGAMAAILHDAVRPNLLQTLEHTPVLVHAGPFANIAHGCSSVLADEVALARAEVVITEAGFGADLGAEKFFNIKCRASGQPPDVAVVVATVRALKAHSGEYVLKAGKPLPPGLLEERPDQVLAGADNLRAHLSIVRRHRVVPVVAINAFPTDHASEHAAIAQVAAEAGVRSAICTNVADGGAGAVELAEEVLRAAGEGSGFRPLYDDELALADKIATIATEVYGADGIELSAAAARSLERFSALGAAHLPICVAKTHLSLTDDPGRVGAPRGWTLPVREVRWSAGAGFVVAVCGEMRLMPGLSSDPAAHRIDLGPRGEVVGLN